MDVLIDTPRKKMLSGINHQRASRGPAIQVGRGTTEPLNIYFLREKYPFNSAAPWEASHSGPQTFTAGITDQAGQQILTQVQATALATNVTHTQGGWAGYKVSLPLDEAGIGTFLGTSAQKQARMEIVHDLGGGDSTSYTQSVTLENLAIGNATPPAQGVGSLGLRRYDFPIDLGVVGTHFLPLKKPGTFHATTYGMLVTSALSTVANCAIAFGWSDDGSTATVEEDDGLFTDGSVRHAQVNPYPTPLPDSNLANATHIYVEVVNVLAGHTGVVTVYGYEEP